MNFSSPLIAWIVIFTAPLPFLICLIGFLFKMQEISYIQTELDRIHSKVVYIEQIQERESARIAPLKNPDPHYLDKHVETLSFLLPEIKKLETLQSECFDNEAIIKRLQSFQSKHNQISFAEEKIRSNDLFKETEELQQYPVELNEEDLKRLLCLIEGITIWPYGPKEGRPLLIIKDFKLTKKELFPKEKVFQVCMQLIKRENLDTH